MDIQSVTCRAGTAYPSGVPEFTSVFCGVRFARCLVFYVMLCISLSVLLSFSFGHCTVCASVCNFWWHPWYHQIFILDFWFEQLIFKAHIDGQWGEWRNSSCSVTCGSGIITRTRGCNSPSPAYGGAECTGSTETVTTCTLDGCKYIIKWKFVTRRVTLVEQELPTLPEYLRSIRFLVEFVSILSFMCMFCISFVLLF